MSSYLSVIESGFLAFPLVAAVCLVPYMIFEYRRYGSIPFWKSLVVFSFLLYAICAYYLIILPLPADHTAYVASAATPQLVPFHELRAMLAHVDVDWTSIRSVLAALRSPYVYQILFNVALTMPLGAFAHYLFHRRWWQVILMGLGVSLFFELTQLSGLYGIYEHPYRICDVDDLITNTSGALLGFWLALPLCHLLPDIDEVNERAHERGRYPSFTRRLLAFGIDMVAAFVCSACVDAALLGGGAVTSEALHADGSPVALLVAALVIGVLFMLVPSLSDGQTMGQRILRMRVVRPGGQRVRWYGLVARYGLLIWVMLMGPAFLSLFVPSASVEGTTGAELVDVVSGIQMVWVCLVLVRAAVARLRGRPFVMIAALMSGTRIMSCEVADELRSGGEVRDGGSADGGTTDPADGETADPADGETTDPADGMTTRSADVSSPATPECPQVPAPDMPAASQTPGTAAVPAPRQAPTSSAAHLPSAGPKASDSSADPLAEHDSLSPRNPIRPY